MFTLSVVAHGPIVPRPGLAEHEVVRPEEVAHGAGPDGVHRAGLQVYQHCPRHVSGQNVYRVFSGGNQILKCSFTSL